MAVENKSKQKICILFLVVLQPFGLSSPSRIQTSIRTVTTCAKTICTRMLTCVDPYMYELPFHLPGGLSAKQNKTKRITKRITKRNKTKQNETKQKICIPFLVGLQPFGLSRPSRIQTIIRAVSTSAKTICSRMLECVDSYIYVRITLPSSRPAIIPCTPCRISWRLKEELTICRPHTHMTLRNSYNHTYLAHPAHSPLLSIFPNIRQVLDLYNTYKY
jgi:hypothetical protein